MRKAWREESLKTTSTHTHAHTCECMKSCNHNLFSRGFNPMSNGIFAPVSPVRLCYTHISISNSTLWELPWPNCIPYLTFDYTFHRGNQQQYVQWENQPWLKCFCDWVEDLWSQPTRYSVQQPQNPTTDSRTEKNLYSALFIFPQWVSRRNSNVTECSATVADHHFDLALMWVASIHSHNGHQFVCDEALGLPLKLLSFSCCN